MAADILINWMKKLNVENERLKCFLYIVAQWVRKDEKLEKN